VAGFELGALLGLDLLGADAVRGIERQVAEILEAPERELRRAAATPTTPVWVFWSMFASPRPLRMLSTSRIESATPTIVPEPPKMLTPPSRTIVMMSSSQPVPRSPRTEPSLDANRTPARPAKKPDVVMMIILSRATLTPE
jgi:hypothetical protein